MDSSKLQIKVGASEFVGEGSEEWLAVQCDKFFEKLAHVPIIKPTSGGSNEVNGSGGIVTAEFAVLSLNSLAAKLKVSNVADLILAACLKLTQGEKTTCTRQELLDEMKKATNYYKATIVKNFTSYLKSVTTSQRLNEQATGVYALPAAVRTELEAKLA